MIRYVEYVQYILTIQVVLLVLHYSPLFRPPPVAATHLKSLAISGKHFQAAGQFDKDGGVTPNGREVKKKAIYVLVALNQSKGNAQP